MTDRSRPRPGPPREYRFPRFTRQVLSNGVSVVVAPVTKLPLVTVMILVDASATTETAGQYGVAALTARLLLEGAGNLNGAALADRFERLGAIIEAHANWDVTAVSLTVMRSRLRDAAALVRTLVREPTFPARELERAKNERLAELLQQLTEPRTLADDRFTDAVYRSDARYARPEGGDPVSVRAITDDTVRAFHASTYAPAGTTLIFAGDISEHEAFKLAADMFNDWSSPPAIHPANTPDAARTGRIVRVVAKADAPQSEVRVGHRGPPRTVSDYFEATVMNAVLGGLFSSRINLNLREVHGYTYGASSGFEWRRGAGPFVIHSAVKSEVTGDAIREILLEVDRIRDVTIGEEELSLATSYLDGVFPIRYETTSAIAAALANMTVYGLSDDYYDTYREHVRGVTAEGVLRAARTHLRPEHLQIVVVGDPAIVASPLEAVTGLPVDITRPDEAAIPS